MGWKDLLQTGDETIVLPWVGGRSLRLNERAWGIVGKLPHEHGWHRFEINARKATWKEPADPDMGALQTPVRGYLVGDRIIPDNVRVDPDPTKINEHSERVHLIEPGLDRFVRVSAATFFEKGPLVYCGQEMPLGPEEAVREAFFDEAKSVNTIPEVTPALDACFRLENWQRAEAEKRRLELERIRREEEEKRRKEEHRQQLIEKLGDANTRRELAQIDFTEAARAALAVGGAQYLDHRASDRRGEFVVHYRVGGHRYTCVCDVQMRIIDAGICLIDHDTGIKGDTWYTLESLPSVVREANRLDKLVVFRRD